MSRLTIENLHTVRNLLINLGLDEATVYVEAAIKELEQLIEEENEDNNFGL